MKKTKHSTKKKVKTTLKTKIKSGIIGNIIGLLIAVGILLVGCGSDDVTKQVASNGEMDAPVVEKLDEMGNVIEETVDTLLQEVSGEKDYLEGMDEDELKALASEALASANLDHRLADNKMLTFGVNFELPEGFEKDIERENFYVTKRYPIEASSVYYAELNPDYTLQLMTENYCEDILRTAFAGLDNQDIDIEINEFELLTIDNIPTFRIKLQYNLDGIHLEHLIYVINGSKTYVIVYTQTDEYDRMELFEESAATIKVKK